jgi:Predicted NAD/FAD-binding protein
MKIAVIGTGISGLAAAWSLSSRHQVTLFEQESRAGGHTNTVTAPDGQWVDTGFIVYNDRNYPNLVRLFEHLKVATQASDMSFGVSLNEGGYEYAGDTLATLFLQRRNLVSPRHWRMLLDILRFNRTTKGLLARGRLPQTSLGAFLRDHGFGEAMALRYLLPMAGAIWSCSTRQAAEFPYPAFARFFDAHGLLNVVDRPQWRMVSGGSRSYVQTLLAHFSGSLRLATPVHGLRRQDGGVLLRSAAGEEHFEAVVSAVHADQALRLLEDADAQEHAVLGAIPYADNQTWLHTDETLLPRRRAAWSSWNYIGEDRLSDDPVAVSYWMNRLQHLPGERPYIVSLNPPRPPRADSVLYHTVYAHPQFSEAAIAAQARLPGLQGKRDVWFCGAWTGYGFHEDGLTSGLRRPRRSAHRHPGHWNSRCSTGR